MERDYTTLVEKLKSKSYDVYEEPYKLNIVGIRKKKPKIKDPEELNIDGANPHNLFLDELVVFFKNDSGLKSIYTYNIATVPDTHYVKKGKEYAILAPNQYKNAWSICESHDLYKCLGQNQDIEVLKINEKKEKTQGDFSIKIHKGNKYQLIGNWSEACQVFKREKDFDEFMSFCYMHQFKHENKFTYTLIEE